MSAGGLCNRAHYPRVCREAGASFRHLGASASDRLVIAFYGGAEESLRYPGHSILGQGPVVSHSMGEHDGHSVVWDYIAVYPPGAVWEDGPPEAVYHGGPVVRVTDPARAALNKALAANPVQIR